MGAVLWDLCLYAGLAFLACGVAFGLVMLWSWFDAQRGGQVPP